jgi:hypothetical protein
MFNSWIAIIIFDHIQIINYAKNTDAVFFNGTFYK